MKLNHNHIHRLYQIKAWICRKLGLWNCNDYLEPHTQFYVLNGYSENGFGGSYYYRFYGVGHGLFRNWWVIYEEDEDTGGY